MNEGGTPFGKLFVLSSPEEMARAAAGRLWGIARERATVLGRGRKETGRILVALSGGETPRLTLTALSSEPYRDRFPWSLVHFCQVDERWLPPDHPSSNRRMLKESLLDRVPVPPDRFHGVDTTLSDPREGARRYEESLREAFGDLPAGRFPRFDAVLLGLGTDGHTASLFPGSPALAERTAWVAATEGGDPPVARVTLTLPVLSAASHVVFLVSGKTKAGILARVLSGSESGLPAARVSPQREKTIFLADADAASGIARKSRPAGGEGRAPGEGTGAG